MELKEFIKPTIGKLIILITILLLTYAIPKHTSMEDAGNYSNLAKDSGFGFPIVFHGSNAISGIEYKGFFILEFVINFLIYYLIACIFIFIHNRITKDSVEAEPESDKKVMKKPKNQYKKEMSEYFKPNSKDEVSKK